MLKKALIVLLVSVLILAGLYFYFSKNMPSVWGDGTVDEKELNGCLDAAADMIRGQLGDDRKINFSQAEFVTEMPSYYQDSYGNNIRKVYGVKGNYKWIDEEKYHPFEYTFSVLEESDIAGTASAIYFKETDSGKEWTNPNVKRHQ